MLSRAEQKIFAILDSRGSSSVSGIREILNDALFEVSYDEAGQYSLFCALHPGMTATVTVE